jgi:hypothetical protein
MYLHVHTLILGGAGRRDFGHAQSVGAQHCRHDGVVPRRIDRLQRQVSNLLMSSGHGVFAACIFAPSFKIGLSRRLLRFSYPLLTFVHQIKVLFSIYASSSLELHACLCTPVHWSCTHACAHENAHKKVRYVSLATLDFVRASWFVGVRERERERQRDRER